MKEASELSAADEKIVKDRGGPSFYTRWPLLAA